jgi:hypothetical protein
LQLADFGLTLILNDSDHSVNLDGAGTVTHLAPEMFKAGTKITKAVDAYAFGILMWEAYTRWVQGGFEAEQGDGQPMGVGSGL